MLPTIEAGLWNAENSNFFYVQKLHSTEPAIASVKSRVHIRNYTSRPIVTDVNVKSINLLYVQ